MEKHTFIKPKIEIVALCENDIIVTSPGIPLPDEWWDEGNGEA